MTVSVTLTALDLLRIGAIQFGQFERPDQPGIFDPLAINLRLLPSYPALLTAIAGEMAPLVRIEGLTHLLTTPAATPIGVAVSLAAEIPLIYPTYPAGNASSTLEGAFDYDVPTILLTDVLSDGVAEQAMIKQAKREGLLVQAIVAVIDFGIIPNAVNAISTSHAWRSLNNLLEALLVESHALTPLMVTAVRDWLTNYADSH